MVQVVATLLVQAVPRPEEHGLAYPGRERDVYRSFDLNYYVVDVKDKERERERDGWAYDDKRWKRSAIEILDKKEGPEIWGICKIEVELGGNCKR